LKIKTNLLFVETHVLKEKKYPIDKKGLFTGFAFSLKYLAPFVPFVPL